MTAGSQAGQGGRLPRCAHRRWGWLLAGMGLAGSLVAQESITNAFSPIVSYQFAEPLGGTGEGLISAVVSYQFAEPLGGPGQGLISALVSYQYYEWPGDDVLGLLSSPWVSYYFPGLGGPQLVLHGQVRGAGGAPLAGATVSVAWGSVPVGTASTDAGGNYALGLGAGPCVVAARAPGYVESSRALTLSPATARQDFQLALRPGAPVQEQVNRPPPSFALPPIGSWDEQLKVFDGTAFVDIAPGNAPSRDRMTIVLTHGWVPQVLGLVLTQNPGWRVGRRRWRGRSARQA